MLAETKLPNLLSKELSGKENVPPLFFHVKRDDSEMESLAWIIVSLSPKAYVQVL